MAKNPKKPLIPVERIANAIFLIRGEKVILDQDLAQLYGVATKVLNQQVTRNIERFPEDFMFQLSKEEFDNLRSQIVTSSQWGGRRYPPRAFTEQGVAMLSSVLKSQQAVLVNVNIMRAFVRLREMLASNKDLARKVAQHDNDIAVLYDYLNRLLEPPSSPKRKIGYIQHSDDDE